MFLQNLFMQNSTLGYEKDGILTVDISRIQENIEAFANELKTLPEVEDVTFGTVLLSSSDGQTYQKWGNTYKDEVIWYNVFPVHHSFLQVMGIDITEGRDFRREDGNVQQGVYIFNESARRKYAMEINTMINGTVEIVGFMPDLKFASFRTAVEPMAFYVRQGRQMNDAYIKLKEGSNIRTAISHIHSTLAGFDKEYTFFEVRFFDEVLQRLYEKEIALSSLITLFSLIAIFISIVGVFGLVVFDSECRRKEIGIRKVLGASIPGIIIMFNKAYFRILVIGFVIAAPLAWYAVTRWLENFAYKTPLYWWVYVLAFVAIGIITACTVTFQNWRMANDNPVNSIMNN
jgi:putative ABC transport system permease protein